jgi:hypothetical protein
VVRSAPKPFDPWTSSAAEALRAHELHGGDGPGPLAQHQAALQVLAARGACLAADGGCEVMRCMAACMANRLSVPGWLADAFLGRHARVVDAAAGTWDEAFRAPWPPRTRLAEVRKRRRLRKAVHAAVFERVQRDPELSFTRSALFDPVGELRGINVCGRVAEDLYYEALADGLPSAKAVRDGLRA